uniref:Uncharacterized protein n=1 Tax=Trichobilharzia regenti TaxID=157069 RepID=A0AA85ISA4_TRIRE|nr:unnamed protein product [Trichobilharzia regenti]
MICYLLLTLVVISAVDGAIVNPINPVTTTVATKSAVYVDRKNIVRLYEIDRSNQLRIAAKKTAQRTWWVCFFQPILCLYILFTL